VQTDILQREAQALCNIIPALLDLECHLQQHAPSKALTSSMLRSGGATPGRVRSNALAGALACALAG